MGKLILKTASITLAAVVGVFGALYAIFAIFSPKVLAAAYDKLGNYGLSVYYYESQYKKTEDLNDLYILCVKLDENSDAKKTEEYLSLLVRDDGYIAFCEEQDASSSAAVSTQQFIDGKYIVCVYDNGGTAVAAARASELVKRGEGYSDYNVFSVLLAEFGTDLSDGDLDLLEAAINSLEGLSADEEINKESDLNEISRLRGLL